MTLPEFGRPRAGAAADPSPRDPAPSRATLLDVARLAGVSLKTASRVFNGEPHVAEPTAAKVHLAAGRLGFRPNTIARELRIGARSSAVGLIISDVANPFYARVARGVERRLRAAGLQLITASSDEDPQLEQQLTAEMLERRVRALLLTSCLADHTHLERERRFGIPVAFLDRPPAGIDADTVAIDNEAGARLAAGHLLGQGHRRIGLIGDLSRLATHRERIAGFESAMTEAGIADWQRYVRSDSHDSAAARHAVADVLRDPNPPTALFTTNNRITIGALHAIRELTPAQPPALVGFDDFDVADLLGVSVIAHSPEHMGEIGAGLVLDQLEAPGASDTGTPKSREVRQHRLPVRLIARGSGERAPAETV